MKKTFLKLSKLSEEYRPLLLSELRLHKQAGSFLDTAKEYAPAVGYGAAGGAMAGIPVALLANALFGKDKSLRGHLRSSLMGAILGGGAGALGGGALRHYTEPSVDHNIGSSVFNGITSLSDGTARLLDKIGLGNFNRKGREGKLDDRGGFDDGSAFDADGNYHTTRTQDAKDWLRKTFTAPR